MRRSVVFVSLLGLSGVLGLSGCTALQDVGQFEEDFSCSVDIRVRNFFPHAQEPGTPGDVSLLSQRRERFGVYAVQEQRQESGEYIRFYMARAFFDPLPAPNVNIGLPFAIEASQNGNELPATLELHADRQTLATNEDHDFFDISEVPDDHSWLFPHACSEEGTVFEHTADFDQLERATTEQPLGLKVRPGSRPLPAGTLMAAQFWVDNTIEIRVVREAIIDGEEVEQARAFYRRGASTDLAITDLEDLEKAEIDLGGVLRDDENVEVIAFLDRNGNGLFDGDDLAVSEDVNFASSAPLPCGPMGRPVVGNVCLDVDDVVVELSIADDSDPTLITEAWWTIVVP